jgi:integrase/recombinase XerD
MTTFADRAENYLQLRRSFGFKLQEHGRLLPRFAAHLDAVGAERVSVDLAVAWATEPVVSVDSRVPALRLLIVRGFARYMAGIDPQTEIPPTGLIRCAKRRRAPYIYTEHEILTLMRRARTAIRQRLAAATYETLIGLLAVTGMRISEAIKLDDTDVDWEHAVLLVRESKFNKSRYLPLHPSTLQALQHYVHIRDELCPERADPSVFISLRRRRLDDGAVQATFRRLCDATRIGAGSRYPPRLHDLRHTMAVRTLLGWYRQRADVEAKLPALSTYLGHLNPAHTYYYLSAAPELLAHAAGMLDAATETQR